MTNYPLWKNFDRRPVLAVLTQHQRATDRRTDGRNCYINIARALMNKCEHAIKPHFIVGLEGVNSTGSIMTGHVPRDAIAIHVTAGIEVNWIKFQNKKLNPFFEFRLASSACSALTRSRSSTLVRFASLQALVSDEGGRSGPIPENWVSEWLTCDPFRQNLGRVHWRYCPTKMYAYYAHLCLFCQSIVLFKITFSNQVWGLCTITLVLGQIADILKYINPFPSSPKYRKIDPSPLAKCRKSNKIVSYVTYIPCTNLRLFDSDRRRLRRLFSLQKEKSSSWQWNRFKKVSQIINIIQIVRWSQQCFCIVNHDTVWRVLCLCWREN